jgi:hypothetical protein
MQVHGCPRDPRDPQAGHSLKQMSRLLSGSGSNLFQHRTTLLASLDFMELVRGHLRILGCLAIEVHSPRAAPSRVPASNTAAASSAACEPMQAGVQLAPAATPLAAGRGAGGSSSSSSSSNTRPATVSMLVMCSCLSNISTLLRDFLCSLLFRAVVGNNPVSQECMRPLLQLVSSPDIVTSLLRLTFSPEVRDAAADESHASSAAATGCIKQLRLMLCTFRSVTQ